MTARIQMAPGESLDQTAGAIRMPASGPAVALAAGNRANWMLGRMPAGHIIAQSWSDPALSWTGYCLHRRHPNCQRVLVTAVVEGSHATGQPGVTGTLTFTPASGSPTTLLSTSRETGVDSIYDLESGWSVCQRAISLSHSGLGAHSWTATNCLLRYLDVMELPRSTLGGVNDERVESRSGGYAGLEVGRRITDSATAGMPALIDAITEARDHSVRHCNWCVPTTKAWSSTTSGSWDNLFDNEFGTTDEGFPHLSRLIRQAEGYRSYSVYLLVATTATTAQVRLSSATTADSVTVTTSSSTYAFSAASGSLDIDCDAVDTLVLEGQITAGSGTVYCAGYGIAEV